MEYLTDTDFVEKTKSGIALIDFYADWCGPCQILGKLIPHLAEKYSGKAFVAKVNADTEFMTTQRFAISGLPTVLVLKDGKEVERLRGLHPPEAYSAVLDKYLDA